MLTHVLELLITDMTAYITLQEGVEKHSIENTFKGSSTERTNALVCLERNLRLKQILSFVKINEHDPNIFTKWDDSRETSYTYISPPSFLTQVSPSSWVNFAIN